MKTTTTTHTLFHWRMKGRALVSLATLLDGYIQRERDENLSLHDKEKASVQADEARRAGDNQLLWRDITEARSVNVLWDVANDADDAGYELGKKGIDWQAEVWFAIADTLRKVAAEAA